ncbi:MAG: hypothetical protein AAF478_14010 [Pseudomonadota bacterium]
MKNLLLKTTMAALVLSSPLAATEASAKLKSIKAHFVQGAYEDYPVFEMKFKNGDWQWVNKNKMFHPRIKLYAKHNNVYDTGARILMEGKEIWRKQKIGKKFELLLPLNITKITLQHKESAARGACKAYGSTSKKVIKDMGFTAKFQVTTSQKNGYGTKNAIMTAKVVCHKKTTTSGTQSANSGGAVLAAVKMYTVPAKPKCGQPVSMVAQFHTVTPGKIKFLYHRSDGKKQNATVVSNKHGQHMVQWMKTYTFNESVNRKYAILVKDQNKSTQWIPLKVNCYASGSSSKSG